MKRFGLRHRKWHLAHELRKALVQQTLHALQCDFKTETLRRSRQLPGHFTILPANRLVRANIVSPTVIRLRYEKS